MNGMDSILKGFVKTGFTGFAGSLFDHSPDENGQTPSPTANPNINISHKYWT